MNKILLQKNLQQIFVSINDAVIEMRFCSKILQRHTGALRKNFRRDNLGKVGPIIFRKSNFYKNSPALQKK